MGIFLDAILNTPEHLREEVAHLRGDFDQLNFKIFRGMLGATPLREGLSLDTVVEDFKMYMNFFNLSFKDTMSQGLSRQEAFKVHEERSHRQIEIILYGMVERS